MREKLLELLAEDSFISGEKLADSLNVSRAAIWKQIKVLQDLGYEIKSVKNKGYKLTSKPDKPIPEEITPYINTKIIGKEFYYFKTLSSTNLIAMEKINQKASEGTIVISDVQTGGKGRKNRRWLSPKGGLWFSVVLYPNIPPQKGMLITMTASVAVAQAIKKLTGLKPVIKWPNDLLIDNKKICGILTEINAEIDRINHAVVGIGINVNNELDQRLGKIASSLKLETGNYVSRVMFLRSFLEYMDDYYEKLIKGNHVFIRDLWLNYSNIIDREIEVKDDDRIITGIVTDVDDSGCLILIKGDEQIRIVCGDVTYL